MLNLQSKLVLTGGIGGAIFTEIILLNKGFPVIYAEENSAKKLCIYDEPKPDVVLVESPTRLEEAIKQARIHVTKTACDLERQFHGVINKWITIEQNTEKTIKEIIAPNERLMPEALYVTVAGLAGTIIARNRNILLRIATPLVFTIASSYYFLPQTSQNISKKFQENQHKYPQLLKVHRSISDIASDAKQKVDTSISDLKNIVGGDDNDKSK
ncbi:751_t:CDS:2 [Funneliformis geosporum]|uniref:MICOS complex subunit n=1 Tax=Funneliformis geosporum TaxID=1117311 RepID=A0A9W4SZ23_9GLOM|nr:751_t:CDS:2 [Funneliformis geosporum]